jgi:hypothetical protein
MVSALKLGPEELNRRRESFETLRVKYTPVPSTGGTGQLVRRGRPAKPVLPDGLAQWLF